MLGMRPLLLLVSTLLLICSVVGSIDTHSARQLDEAMSMPSSGSVKGSGKGKGGSSLSEDESEDSGKGKGGSTKGSSSKGSKKGSSKGSTKSSKKGKGKGGDSPTAPSMPSAPSPSTPTTPAPTSEDSIPVKALPYTLAYTIEDDEQPEKNDWVGVEEVTRRYMLDFMAEEFDQTQLTNLDGFLTVLERDIEGAFVPRGIYRSTGMFNPSSIFLPTVRELNELIDDAFKGDNLDEYLRRVRSLPNGNAFRNTVAIQKGLAPTPKEGENTKASGGSFVMGGAAAAAAGFVVLVAGVAILKRKQEEELEDPYEKSFGKNLKGDATVAGETCNISLDGSSWRKESPYADNDEEDEFDDEPLDNDEDSESRSGRSGRHPPSDAFQAVHLS